MEIGNKVRERRHGANDILIPPCDLSGYRIQTLTVKPLEAGRREPDWRPAPRRPSSQTISKLEGRVQKGKKIYPAPSILKFLGSAHHYSGVSQSFSILTPLNKTLGGE